MLSPLISKTNKYYYHFLLTALFVSVGFVISAISIVVSGYYQLNAIHKEFDNAAKSTLAYKQNFLYAQTKNFQNNIMAVAKNSEFKTFLQNDPKERVHEKEHITELMTAIAYSDTNIMQFRFIGENGHEVIRIDRETVGSLPYVVNENALQDKAQRYYFQAAKAAGEGKIWYSNIDLNIEHERIVRPIVPTLRIAQAYYVKGAFKGILIINIFMKDILDEVMESELFHVAIINKESHILSSNIQGSQEAKKEWTRYLEEMNDARYTTDNYKDDFLLGLLFKKEHFSAELNDIIKNDEGLKIILEKRVDKLLEYTKTITDYIVLMSVIVFVLSIPIALIVSRYPLKLHNALEKLKNDLKTQLDIIDKYICISRTNIEGDITDVSTAFTKLTGYTKAELIGQNHRILKAEDTPVEVYEKMWHDILNGKSWTGVLKNVRKDAEPYWIINHITPILENGEITGFTAIREDITKQKLIEEISIKDELTQAYNRRFFNQIFFKELKSAKRKGEIFCVAMFDIDYFKQYNDTYGHIKGNDALQKVVKQISSKLKRASDYIFRVGGEEFIVTYSDVKSFHEAEHFSQELIKAVEELQIEHKASDVRNVLTISLGLLSVMPMCDIDEKSILQRIDELLYRAKADGRNRVVSQECYLE